MKNLRKGAWHTPPIRRGAVVQGVRRSASLGEPSQIAILTEVECAELEGLARSGKTEHRLWQRARIILLAAEGAATQPRGQSAAR